MHLFARLPPKGWLDRILAGGAINGCQQGRGRGRKRRSSAAAGQIHLPKFPSLNFVALWDFWNSWHYWFRKPGKPGSQPSSPSTGLWLAHSEFSACPTWCWRVSFSSVDCLPACCLLLSQVGLTASLLALIVERVVHAAKKNSIWSTAETLHYGKKF